MSEVLKADALVKHYRQGDDEITVLRGVSFSVAAGERVAVVGSDVAFKKMCGLLIGEDDIQDVMAVIEQLAGGGKPTTLQAVKGSFDSLLDPFRLAFVFQMKGLDPLAAVPPELDGVKLSSFS